MSSEGTSSKYHIPVSVFQLHGQPTEQLKKWASDPNCIEQAEVFHFLVDQQQDAAAQALQELKRKQLAEQPFDPRTEVSADAKYIARRVAIHLWILLVALPIVLAIILYNLR